MAGWIHNLIAVECRRHFATVEVPEGVVGEAAAVVWVTEAREYVKKAAEGAEEGAEVVVVLKRTTAKGESVWIPHVLDR